LAWTPGASVALRTRVEYSLLRSIEIYVLVFRVFSWVLNLRLIFSVISVTDVTYNRLLFRGPRLLDEIRSLQLCLSPRLGSLIPFILTTSIPTMAPVTIDWAKIDNPHYVFERSPSRRSVVYGTKGVVACSQVRTPASLKMSCETYDTLKPLACQAGLEILNRGGNASKLDGGSP
jgi:hypothetical protein